MSDSPSDDLAARLDETGQLLVRSGIEIEHTMEEIRAAGGSLVGDLLSDEHLFISRLLEVDAQHGTMTVAWSDSKEANAGIMAMPSITFSISHQGVHFRFVVEHPREAEHGGQPAIQFALPKAMLALQRRSGPRYKVPPAVPLMCQIELGPLSFEAKVVDVSRSGIGAIIYDAAIRLEAGMIIRRARILLPPHAPVLAGLEVRHISTVTRPDGSVAKRAGCRFIAPSSGLEAMVHLFIAAVEATPARAS